MLNHQADSKSNLVKNQIHTSVEKVVNLKLKAMNKDINTVIIKIKDFATNEYEKSFTKLYRYSIFFVFLSTFTCLLFPRKKDSYSN